MTTTRPAVATPFEGKTASAAQVDEPRLARWAHICTLVGFLLIGLSVVGIVLASMAVRRGEFGAKTTLRNAIAVTLFQLILFLAIVAISSFL